MLKMTIASPAAPPSGRTTHASRVLRAAAWIFLASGIFHAAVWVIAGMPSLEGPVTWRKPITFGFSTAVLFYSLAWVLSLIPARPSHRWQAWTFTVLLILEIALIDMQQWRGVASHFNNDTPFDSAVFTTMGALIMAASVIIVWWTRDVFREPLATTSAYAFAARAGMVMLNVGNLVGLAMAVTATTALKPVHGLALHGLQALPIAVWVVSLRYPRAWRDSRVWSGRSSQGSLRRQPHS
jgi:hypothetical protein